jgi:hypothetical protein
MLRTRAHITMGLMAGALAGCPSTPPPAPTGTVSPSGLSVTQETVNSLILRWTRPSMPFDSYTLEVSDVVHPFQQIGGPIPASWDGVTLSSQTPFPELLHLYFRLTAIAGGQPLGPAATAEFLEPLRALDATATYVDGGIVVSWLTASTAANGVEISRQHFRLPEAPGSSPPSVTEVPLTPASYLDTDLEEATSYQYTVTLRAGAGRGTPSIATATSPLLPPIDLVTTPRAGGVDLQWTNQSAAATGLVVLRSAGIPSEPGESIATLAADAGSYRDVPPVPGLYTYRVETRRSGYVPGGVSGGVFAPPGGALLFDAALLPAQQGLEAVRNTSGEWTVCGSDGVLDLSGHRPPLPSGGGASPCVLLDPAQQPHHPEAVFVGAGTAMTFLQAWFDGTQWLTEQIVSGPGVGSPWFALDSQGQAHAIWQIFDENNQPVSFHYARRTAGAWIAEPVPLAPAGYEFPLDVAVDGSGVVHVVTYPALDHLQRANDAGWSRESLPLNWGATERPPVAHLRVIGTSDLLLAFVWNDWLKPGDRLEVLARVDGGWSSPEVVASRNLESPDKGFRMAVMPAGERTALTFSSPHSDTSPGWTTLFVRTDGDWSRTAIGDDNSLVMGLGFDSQGKLHGLELIQDPRSGTFQFDATFDEVP